MSIPTDPTTRDDTYHRTPNQDTTHPQDDPDAIRADIDATRAELSANVDALGDRLNPKKVAERQTEKVKDAVGTVKDKVFGVADSAGDHVANLKDSAVDAAQATPRTITRSTQGSPLAAGLVAAGLGFLLGSLLPSSQKERETMRQVKDSDAVSTVTEEAKTMAQDMGEHLKEPARQAAEEVKATAQQGVENVKETASEAGATLKDETTTAAATLKDDTTSAAARVRDPGAERPLV